MNCKFFLTKSFLGRFESVEELVSICEVPGLLTVVPKATANLSPTFSATDTGNWDADLKPDPDVDHAQDQLRTAYSFIGLFHLFNRRAQVKVGELVGAVILLRLGFIQNFKVVVSCITYRSEV